ncbi:hypothetical protein ALC60_01545 [Trachymyrmex zeteki]|uniref:YqaJ viral recombinase domain-containing protein n=1 Tax=Mycetomoellerius zeteki TaxID=64791 RepID=A0A151XGA5_9HYME|nr:hypothetical protein ALC60_01545 [Trachymyrmex zeteki]
MAQPGFVKAQSDNLPRVDVVMVLDFFANNPTLSVAESRGVKVHRYGDAAIGYVEICRQKTMYIIRAKICPEHKVRTKAYAVELTIDERKNKIKNVQCFDCAAFSDIRNVTNFLLFAKQHMSSNLCIEAAKATKEQSSCPLWYELRYGKITASTIYEAANCKTTNEVLQAVEKKLRMKFYSTGLILLPDYPIFGASPDSYTDNYIIEVKCPLTEKSEDKYICKDGSVAKKFYSQMQIQMMFAKRTKGLFCMAKFDFETSKKVNRVGGL